MKTKRKVPIIRQMSQTECGITSLSMIFSYYGYEGALEELRKDVYSSRNGISMLTLKKIGESYNFDVKALKGSIDYIKNVQKPIILFWENNHFVVLEKVKGKYFYIVDPALGKYSLEKDDVLTRYSGYALLMCPNEDFVPQKAKRKMHINIFASFLQHKLAFVMMMIIAIIIQISVIFLPITIKYVIDNAIGVKSFWDIQHADVIIFLMISILIVQILFNYLNSYVINRIQRNVDKVMIPGFVKHLISLPIKFFNARSTGDLVLRTNNLEDVRMLVLNQLVAGFLNLTTLVVVINYMFSQSIILSFGLLGVGIIQMMLIIYGSKRIQPISNMELAYKAEQNSKLSEMIHSIHTIKSLNEEENFFETWKESLDKKVDATYKVGLKKASIDSLLKSLSIVVPIILTFVGVFLTIAGELTIGSLFGFLSLTAIFLMPFNNIAESIVNINKTKSILNFIQDVGMNESEQKSGELIRNIEGHVEFHNVSFRFDKYSSNILSNISLDIPARSNLAIIGTSGSGKSTLLSLLTGIHKPTQGSITIDNEPLSLYDVRNLREQIGVVTQEFSIFNKTIYENITLNNKKYTERDVYEALAAASLLEEVVAMPQGINTMLAENGTNISGGQRQRLAIARALIKKPKILILDESTSSLDIKNERAIDDFLKSNGATKITTSHDLKSLKNMDKIIIIDGGKKVAEGSYEEIVNSSEFKKYIGDDLNG
ncbi:MAG: peptidase domain-containing ABC transporter [Staphylococcus rostri]|uniref:peptidase domain-containing ABC transporter n=1 Tax=Staphylococcus rostri TaxID=522262 RepID=UPI0026DFEB32|nr:peptidase domain-containing ABC transporter [Staphylococcus rostri]MDO5376488.1 peptidase domain-containing ABC transporter [Staphylococcus rostri]